MFVVKLCKDPRDIDKDYAQQCSSEVKLWGQKMKKFAHCEISPLSTSRDYPSEYAL